MFVFKGYDNRNILFLKWILDAVFMIFLKKVIFKMSCTHIIVLPCQTFSSHIITSQMLVPCIWGLILVPKYLYRFT